MTAVKDTRTLRHSGHRVPHFCARCGQCLCDCKPCAVYYPCCCDPCWAAGPPVKSTHNCTCAPVGALT